MWWLLHWYQPQSSSSLDNPLLLVHLFPPYFFLPVNFNTALCEQPSFSAMTCCCLLRLHELLLWFPMLFHQGYPNWHFKIISFSKSINMLLWNRSYQEKVFQRYNGKTQIAVPYMSCASDLYSILLLLIHYWAVNEPCSRSSWSIFQKLYCVHITL